MRSNHFIAKCTAILMLVLFSQKIGVGVYLHNWLHSTSSKEAAAKTSVAAECNCIDDFSTPLTQINAEIVIALPLVHHQQYVSIQQSFTSFQKLYHSLRAPPASYNA